MIALDTAVPSRNFLMIAFDFVRTGNEGVYRVVKSVQYSPCLERTVTVLTSDNPHVDNFG